MEAFVYCWTDNKTGKLYIGSHKGDPMDGYICSSKLMLEEYNKRPEDFTRQIVAEGTWDEMFKFEGKLLSAFDVKNDHGFYNQHNGSGDFRNKGLSQESIEKMRQTKIGKPSKKKGIPSGYPAWNKGKTKDTDPRINKYAKTLSVVNKGIEGYWKGKKLPESVRQNLSKVNIGNKNAGVMISTPYGIFESKRDAMRKLGISKWSLADKMKKDPTNWRLA